MNASWIMPGRCRLSLLAWAGVLVAGTAAAQVPSPPHLGYVYPAGGRQGLTFHVIAGGQQIRAASEVYVTGAGVRATVIRPVPLMRKFERDQLPDMRKRLLVLRQDPSADTTPMEPGTKAVSRRPAPTDTPKTDTPKTDAPKPDAPAAQSAGKPAPRPNAPREIDVEALSLRELEAYLNIARTFDKRQANAQIADGLLIEITIDPAAAPGDRELRLSGPGGLSNPLRFQVGCIPEISESEPIGRATPEASSVLTLPCTINGQVMPADADLFRFKARRAQRLVIDAQARRLIPYMADAVPGWFQAVVTVSDAGGRELASADDYRVNPDPTLLFQVPADGEYTLKIHDALYRGREDFVYRVSIGELPFVTQIFPLGGREGAAATTAVTGWNLPHTRATLGTGEGPGPVRSTREFRGKWPSNEIPYAVDDLPEVSEPASKNGQTPPTPVLLPHLVNGRIGTPDETDVYQVEGKAGQELVAEVCARRLNSPLDSRLSIADAAGTVLAWNDDMEPPATGLLTHNADSYLRVTLPADGVYSVRVADATGHGGDEYAYRLRLSGPRPDFELRVTPSSLNVGAGRVVPVTAHLLRRDGFDGDVKLTLTGAPPGFSLQGALIPQGRDRVRFTLAAPPEPSRQPLSLSFEGRARIGEKTVTHPAVPAEDMMQAFLYRHLVPSQELVVKVVGGRQAQSTLALRDTATVRIPSGGTAEVLLKVPAASPIRDLDLALSEPPPGVTLESVKDAPGGLALVLKADEKTAPIGLRDNLIVEGFRRAAKAAAPGTPPTPARQARASVGVLPAIPFEVVRP